VERRLEQTRAVDPRPDFRAIALGRHVSQATRERQVAADVGPAALVKGFIGSLGIGSGT